MMTAWVLIFITVGQASSGHFGLLDMRERAEKIGAHFSLHQPDSGHGTEILLLITDATTNNSSNSAPIGSRPQNLIHSE